MRTCVCVYVHLYLLLPSPNLQTLTLNPEGRLLYLCVLSHCSNELRRTVHLHITCQKHYSLVCLNFVASVVALCWSPLPWLCHRSGYCTNLCSMWVFYQKCCLPSPAKTLAPYASSHLTNQCSTMMCDYPLHPCCMLHCHRFFISAQCSKRIFASLHIVCEPLALIHVLYMHTVRLRVFGLVEGTCLSRQLSTRCDLSQQTTQYTLWPVSADHSIHTVTCLGRPLSTHCVTCLGRPLGTHCVTCLSRPLSTHCVTYLGRPLSTHCVTCLKRPLSTHCDLSQQTTQYTLCDLYSQRDLGYAPTYKPLVEENWKWEMFEIGILS